MSAEPEVRIYRVFEERGKLIWNLAGYYKGRLKASTALTRYFMDADREPGNYVAEDYLGRQSKCSWDGDEIRAAA